MNNETIKLVPNRLKFFPIMMFAIVMGLSGLTIVFQKAHEILNINSLVGDILAFIDSFIFILIILFYLAKIFKYFDEVKKELEHPIRINFFASSAISFLLVSIVYHPINLEIAKYCFYIGTFMQTFFTFYTISFWINKNLEIAHSNPAWFIPIVGNVLVPVAGVSIVDNNFLMYYFSVGIFFWIVLTSLLINRIIFHHQLMVKFVPTLFIFIAPPSVSFIAYVKMTGEFDTFASILFNLALFFTFLLIFMYKNFLNLQFFISWWAFTFPLAAVTIATMFAYSKTSIVFYSFLSYFFLIMTSIIVVIVAYHTLKHMMRKEICIME